MIRPVAFFALDGVQTLDVTGPMEVFAVANTFGAQYALHLASASGATIQTHAGLQLGPATRLAALPSSLDTLVVCGGSEAAMRAASTEGSTTAWLRAHAPALRRVVSICTGAFVLAAAGLLDGRRATTHWRTVALFEKLFPQVRLEADAIFVSDPPFHTSAGVTAGIDLALALVEADHGPELALAVARELVLFLRRPGGQTQFSQGAGLQAQGEPRITRLAARILDDPAGQAGEGRSLPALAAAVGMSERSFLRAFRKATGQSPARFVEEARLARARALLEASDDPLERVAERAGYGSCDSLFRAFRKSVGITPQDYRLRFGRVHSRHQAG
ncbi:MAG: GlxA family transcriptional regulator [Pararhodobacter sp.]